MRFRFCWDCDCPDWLLAEMTSISKMKSYGVLRLAGLVAKSISGELKYDEALQITAESNMDESTTRAVIAALRWVLESASGSETESHILGSELQQLGLPKEHATAIERIFSEYQAEIARHLSETSLKVSSGMQYNHEIKGVQIGEQVFPVAELNLKGQMTLIHQNENGQLKQELIQQANISVTKEQIDSILMDLKEAHKQLKDLE